MSTRTLSVIVDSEVIGPETLDVIIREALERLRQAIGDPFTHQGGSVVVVEVAP